jgi:AcrR family transcriptional regulator
MNKRSAIESKQRILKAALKVFSKRGYAGANVREIAGAAEISIGGVYLYFKNKEELYLSLIRDRIFEKSQKAKEIVDSGLSPRETLAAFVMHHIEYALQNRELIFIHLRDHGFTYDMNMKRKFFQQQTALLKTVIERGMRSGEFRKCNSLKTAKMIMSLLRGTVLSLALENEKEIKAAHIQDFILNGLLRKGRSST